MLTVPLLTTVTVGNHVLTDAEVADGVPQRPPFVDGDGLPVDPDTVRIRLTSPAGVDRWFGYPEAGPDDLGTVTRQEAGRFYVQWQPAHPEDGLWTWELTGQMELGTGQSDQDAFYVQRSTAAVP